MYAELGVGNRHRSVSHTAAEAVAPTGEQDAHSTLRATEVVRAGVVARLGGAELNVRSAEAISESIELGGGAVLVQVHADRNIVTAHCGLHN